MKICTNCNQPLEDNAAYCYKCGTQFSNEQQANSQVPPQGNYGQTPEYTSNQVSYADPYDHTGEFEPKDISENKVISMLVYLMGAIGIVIALLASNTSKYAAFHVRQALKFTVIEILSAIITVLLCWTIIVPMAYAIFILVLTVIKFICFFQICAGKAKEPAIIRSFGFLR